MKRALKTFLTLFLIFGSLALLFGFFVDFDDRDVERVLMASKERPEWVFASVVALLAVDSVLAIPSTPTVIIAGYLLGPWWGGLSSFLGMMVAGSICYWSGRVVGSARWWKKEAPHAVSDGTAQVVPVALLLARAAPMLPEVLSAMAGSSRMPMARYYLYYGSGHFAFALLVAYAGSKSSLEEPWPAIAAGLTVPVLGAIVVFMRRRARARGDAQAEGAC